MASRMHWYMSEGTGEEFRGSRVQEIGARKMPPTLEEEGAMNNLRESLEELMLASADKVLAEGFTPEGTQALARVTLLLAMIDRLDASGEPWEDCDILPARVPLFCVEERASSATLLQ